MALAITVEQEQLVDAVSRFAARHAPIDKTRAAFGSIAAGELPSWWPDFVDSGFHAVHLPVHVGGQDGTLADMACVVEAVEALTIVLAAGLTREWRSTFAGLAVALLALAVIVAVLGPTVSLLPLTALRLVIVSIVLATTALVASELFARRATRRLHGN